MALRSKVTVTRPANVTAYTANDVVGGAITFPDMSTAPSGGGRDVTITSVSLRIDVSAVPAGMTTMVLHLYSVTPPSALADNAAWDLPAGDRASYLGFITIGTPADMGSTLFCQTEIVNKQVRLGSGETALYGYLVTTAGFTPAGNSEVYVPMISGMEVRN